MSASHFFVGLGAGIAILAVPVLTLTPGREVPGRLIGWIEGPAPQPRQITSDDAAISRPRRGYRPGDPTPGPEEAPPPTLVPIAKPTTEPAVPLQAPSVATGTSSLKTGVIRSGGAAVVVHRVVGVDSADDPQIPDGSPVLVSTEAPTTIAGQQWRSIRGLSGVAGWVPASQVAVDGEPARAVPLSQTAPTPVPNGIHGVIANTDGAGVVLRNSPNDADRTHSGLMDGAGVTILERAGNDWVHVRADNGQIGWIPARYLTPN